MYRLTEYGGMLRDRRRIEAYRRALASIVTPTSVVLDLGTGLGTFAILAARLGAARVYAVDAGDIITVAAENARASGVRMECIQASAAELELPEQVDVIVSDLSGALPLYEEHLPSLIRVRDAFLRPGGALIPMRDRLFCAPATGLQASIVEPWRGVDGVDFSPAERMALHAPHPVRVMPEQLVAEPQCWAELDYATIGSPNVSAAVEWELEEPAEIDGVALWFESTLREGIISKSGPWSEGSVHATMVLPLLAPLQARDGFRLTLDATLAAGRYVISWQAGDGPRQSTFLSEPRSAASLTARNAVNAAPPAEAETFRVSEHALCRRVGDDALLFDTAAGTYHVLNETGARVWELLEQGQSMATIATAVAAEYDVDAQRAAEDVAAIVAQLREANLVV